MPFDRVKWTKKKREDQLQVACVWRVKNLLVSAADSTRKPYLEDEIDDARFVGLTRSAM